MGTNEDGKVFTKSQQIVIDNTLPTLKMNTHGGVYEVDDTGLKISGNIYDATVDLLNKNGDNVDQSTNKVKVTGASNPIGNVPLVVDSKGNFEYTSAKANILGQPQMTINNKFGQGINIIPTYSILEGGFLPDGFVPNGFLWLDPKKDYSKVGAEVYIIGGSDGKLYEATINSAARFSVPNLPLLDQSYEIVIKIPGHFERHVKVDEMVDTYDGTNAGKLKYFYYASMSAGDVNHDNVGLLTLIKH